MRSQCDLEDNRSIKSIQRPPGAASHLTPTPHDGMNTSRQYRLYISSLQVRHPGPNIPGRIWSHNILIDRRGGTQPSFHLISVNPKTQALNSRHGARQHMHIVHFLQKKTTRITQTLQKTKGRSRTQMTDEAGSSKLTEDRCCGAWWMMIGNVARVIDNRKEELVCVSTVRWTPRNVAEKRYVR